MATTPQSWQVQLNVFASAVTIATGTTNGTQISSLWIMNNDTVTRTVTIALNGTANTNIMGTFTLAAGGSTLVPMPNSPIVLTNGITLKAWEDSGTTCNITAFGLNM